MTQTIHDSTETLKAAIERLDETDARAIGAFCIERADKLRADYHLKVQEEAARRLQAAHDENRELFKRAGLPYEPDAKGKGKPKKAAKPNAYPFKSGHTYGLKTDTAFRWTMGHGGKRPKMLDAAKHEDVVDLGVVSAVKGIRPNVAAAS